MVVYSLFPFRVWETSVSSTLPSGTVSRTTIILTTQGAAAAVVTREFVVPGERNGNDDDTEGTRKNKEHVQRINRQQPTS